MNIRMFMGFRLIGDLLLLSMVGVNLSQEGSALDELLFGVGWKICADLILQTYQLFERLQLGRLSLFSLTSF